MDDAVLRQAVSHLSDVLANAADADNLWRAMQWTEVAAVADVLHAAGHVESAGQVVRWWGAAVDLNDEAIGPGADSPSGRLRSWGIDE